MWSCPYPTHYNTTAVDHIVDPVQLYSHCIYIQLPANMSLLNEFMCGPLDIQDIKGETDAEAEHDTGLLPDWLITQMSMNQWYPPQKYTELLSPQTQSMVQES